MHEPTPVQGKWVGAVIRGMKIQKPNRWLRLCCAQGMILDQYYGVE